MLLNIFWSQRVMTLLLQILLLCSCWAPARRRLPGEWFLFSALPVERQKQLSRSIAGLAFEWNETEEEKGGGKSVKVKESVLLRCYKSVLSFITVLASIHSAFYQTLQSSIRMDDSCFVLFKKCSYYFLMEGWECDLSCSWSMVLFSEHSQELMAVMFPIVSRDCHNW